MSLEKAKDWLRKQEARLSAKWLKRTMVLLLMLLTFGIPAYAGIADITIIDSVPPASQSVGASEAISAITSFYQTIFAALAIVMGLIVALAYLTIRAVSRETLQESVQREVQKNFENDRKFWKEVGEQVDEAVLNALAANEFVAQLDEQERRLQILESHLVKENTKPDSGVVEP